MIATLKNCTSSVTISHSLL